MGLPPKLYKYQSFTTLNMKALKDQQIFFSRSADFNDPFDCSASAPKFPLSEKEYQEIYDSQLAHLSSARDKRELEAKYISNGKLNGQYRSEVASGIEAGIEGLKKTNRYNRGVACFSAKNNDLLMWAHYADGHRGFCLEFDTHYKPFNNALEVKYDSQLPTINLEMVLAEPITLETFRIMVATKYQSWAYEEEWRLIHEESQKLFGYEAQALTGVYLGAEIDFSHLEIIALILRGQNPDVQLYQGQLSPKMFQVNFTPRMYTPHIDIPNQPASSSE